MATKGKSDEDNQAVHDESDFEHSKSGYVYWYLPPQVRQGSFPLFDNETGQIVGFRFESGGFFIIYDIEGNVISSGEPGLESPLLDPIDFLAGGLAAKLLGKTAARIGGGMFGKTMKNNGTALLSAGARGGIQVAKSVLIELRGVFRAVKFKGTLLFAKSAGMHMMESGRHVPIHVMKLCLRYGKRMPDPRGAAGAYRYTMTMFRESVTKFSGPGFKSIQKGYSGPIYSKYELEVVIREADKMVLHFKYNPF